jgi:hypothetical protein
MTDFFKNLSNTQFVLIVLIVLAVLYIFMHKPEKLENTKKSVQITNTSSDKQDATQLKQDDIQTPVMLYDRKTGVVTAASEFVGLPDEIEPTTGSELVSNYGRIDRLDDGYNGGMGLNYNMCSKSCCSSQYPPPFALEKDVMVDKMKDKFVPNNYMCNNSWNNTGCVCMTAKQRDYIEGRGGNGTRPPYDN